MDEKRIEYVGAKFRDLQGFRLLPLVALLFLASAWLAGSIRLPGDEYRLAAAWWFVLGVDLAVAASIVGYVWYHVRYGIADSPFTRRLLASSGWPMVKVLAWLFVAVAIQEFMNLPFSLPMAWLAAAVAARGIVDRFRRHYLAASVPLFAFMLLSPLGVSASTLDILFPATLGTALAIAAIGDHRLLVTTPLYKTPADV